MSTSSALDQQRKIPSRERRQQKRQVTGSLSREKPSKVVASSVANANTLKRPSQYVSTPPPRTQQRGLQDGSHLLNFRAPERQRDSGSRPLPHRRRGPVVHFDKDRFFGANYRFVVARDSGEDYAVHLAFADKSVDWALIREVHVSEETSYNCPICLEAPIAARLTQCGHIYCWPCIKRLLHVSAKHYAPCPICTTIVTSSREMLKPAKVHVHDPVKVDKDITLELMRRERGSTVAIRATSLPESQVSTINAQVGLPRVGEGAAGLLCPMDAAHRDAKFLKMLSVKDTKMISERERNELLDALKLSHSSGEVEMVPFIESCLRDLEMHASQDAAAAAELAEKPKTPECQASDPCSASDPSSVLPTPTTPATTASGDGTGVRWGVGSKASASASGAVSVMTLSATASSFSMSATAHSFSPTAFSPTAAPYSPVPSAVGRRGGGGRGGAGGSGDSPSHTLNRSASFSQKIWLDGELVDTWGMDEEELDDSDDDYAHISHDDDDDQAQEDIEREAEDQSVEGAEDTTMEGGAGESASVSAVGSESASRRESLASEEEVQETKESNAQAQCKDFAVDGIHFFYQSSDGQKVFLHPVSMRCLLEEYGSYLALPRTIKGKVLDLEICMQTEELRKRHKALEHVPLSADIRFVEVDVVGMLSKGTLEKMRSKLEERTKLRRQRAKHQAQAQLRAQQKERREREKKNPPPPHDMLHGPSLIASMAHAQAQFDHDMLEALLLSESLSPALPSEVGGAGASGGFGAPSPSTPSGESPSSAAGVRWTQMVQEGRSAGRQLQVEREEYFPSLGGDPFPTLGAAPAMSPSAKSGGSPSTKSGATGWAKLASSAPVSPACAVSAGWATRNPSSPSSALSSLAAGAGKGVAQVVGRSAKSERGERAAGVGGRDESIFEMDDLDQEMCAEERQRRRTEAAAKAWETALAATAAQAGQDAGAQGTASQGAAKAKKGRKGVLLAWG